MGNPFKNAAGSPGSFKDSYKRPMQAYNQYLPGYAQSVYDQATPNAQAQLGAYNATMPGYNATNLQQLQQYGLPTTAVQQQIADSNAQQGAQTNLNLLRGTGGQAAGAAMDLSRSLNPNYWNVQDNSSRQAGNLLNSFNINGLSPGEYNATERAINQGGQGTGNLGLINNTNTLSNALNFGGAFNTKQALMGNAINTANQTAQSGLNNGVNPTQLALGTSQTNTGNVASFNTPTMTQTVNPTTPNNIAQGLMGNMVDITNGFINPAAQSKFQNSALNQYKVNSDSLQNYSSMAGACCFIFLESYNGVLPWYVRVERDKYYEQEPRIANGYKRMAKWLVPLMRRFKFVKTAVNLTMVKPLTWYGGHTHKVNSFGHVFWPVKKAWFTVWKQLGKEAK